MYAVMADGRLMDYDLYHDESLEGGYWHGMLLVPSWHKAEFADLLMIARKNSHYLAKIGIKKVKRKGPIYACASAWTQIGVACLRSTTRGKAEHVFLGARDKGRLRYGQVNAYGTKFILFRERESHRELTAYRNHTGMIETTFRFGLKGGLHFLGSEDAPITIGRIHFDGHQHYRRHIDKGRVVDRIEGLRQYCAISTRADLVDDRESDHEKPGSQDYEDCQFLQLTDILVGCFRTCLGYRTREIHSELALPVRNLLSKYREGYARMKNSRWADSFVMSQCYLKDNGKWVFEPIDEKRGTHRQLRML